MCIQNWCEDFLTLKAINLYIVFFWQMGNKETVWFKKNTFAQIHNCFTQMCKISKIWITHLYVSYCTTQKISNFAVVYHMCHTQIPNSAESYVYNLYDRAVVSCSMWRPATTCGASRPCPSPHRSGSCSKTRSLNWLYSSLWVEKPYYERNK